MPDAGVQVRWIEVVGYEVPVSDRSMSYKGYPSLSTDARTKYEWKGHFAACP